jgi:hypothetical protein
MNRFHAVAESMRATASHTDMASRIESSSPPYFRSANMLNKPASNNAW